MCKVGKEIVLFFDIISNGFQFSDLCHHVRCEHGFTMRCDELFIASSVRLALNEVEDFLEASGADKLLKFFFESNKLCDRLINGSYSNERYQAFFNEEETICSIR